VNKLFSFIAEVEKNIKINRHIRKSFPQETLFMRGRHVPGNNDQSILYFTVHRCASRFVAATIKRLMTNSGMTHIDLAGYVWHGGKVYGKDTDIYKKSGYVYGPFYGLDREELDFPVSDFDDFRILLMLRDPRDVLTSYYFHHAFDAYYNPAQQEFIDNRSKMALNKTVDEWVLEKTPVFRERYKAYLEKFHGRQNVFFTKYEDMIADFNKWLRGLTEFMNLQPGPEIMESIVKKTSFSVDKENVKSHKRQVTPGDHMRKLKEDTIKILNSEFGEILAALDYK
jgi:hypothetical protein